MNSQLSNDIEITSHQASYDECCKMLLSNKKILANILKECIIEFKDFNVDYIAENCIETNPEISNVSVHRNTPEKITGSNTEDKTVKEGAVYFDIRFFATLPQSGERIRLIINLEAQKDYYPGYRLVRRGIYYCCRLISAQYGTEFTDDNYDDIKSVYSIWVCLDTPVYAQNTITRYKITEENIIGDMKEDLKNYDLINVIMVCLGKDSEDAGKTGNGILKLLRVLLSDILNPKEKKEILNADFGLETDSSLEKEMSKMCNLSDKVLDRGIEIGREQGIKSTVQICKEIGISLHDTIKKISENFGLSENEIETKIKQYW